jgi:uncharacterized protein (TIGR03437 family)
MLASSGSAVVNATDGSRSLRPGSFIQISGQNLASQAAAADLTAPTVLGGSCVTFSDIPALLIQTAPGQIVAQVPTSLSAGSYVLQVRSLATGQRSDAVVTTVSR